MFSSMDMEFHSFISYFSMVFDVAIETEDTNCGINGHRSSTCDGRKTAGAEITSSEADRVVVKKIVQDVVRSSMASGKDNACK